MTTSSEGKEIFAHPPRFAVVVDLSCGPAAAVRDVGEALIRATARDDVEFLIIVGEAPEGAFDDRMTFVEAGPGFGAVERLSLALQMARSEHVLVGSTAVHFESNLIDHVDEILLSDDIVEVHVPTRLSLDSSGPPIRSSRTVVFGMTRAKYVELRGLDLRIGALRDAYEDLVRRVRAWGGTLRTLDSPDSLAYEPDKIETAPPQSFDVATAKGIFVNLPRWKYRPFASSATMQLVRMNAKASTALDGISAQSMDGYEVVDLTAEPGQEDRVLREHLAAVGSMVVAPVAPETSVPPWRLLEQVQHLRSASTYCVGRAAYSVAGEIRILPNGPIAQPMSEPNVEDMTTLLGRADILLELMTGSEGRTLHRAQSSHIVSCTLRETDRPHTVEPSLRDNTRIAPYASAIDIERVIIFDQFTVGKIDYIDGYARTSAIATLFSASGKPLREVAAVHSPTQRDIDLLAELGLAFTMVSLVDGLDSTGVVVDEVLSKKVRTSAVLELESDPASLGWRGAETEGLHLFIRDQNRTDAWYAVLSNDQERTGEPVHSWRQDLLTNQRVHWETR